TVGMGSAPATFRLVPITVNPRWASNRAVACPTPDEAPVMRTTLGSDILTPLTLSLRSGLDSTRARHGLEFGCIGQMRAVGDKIRCLLAAAHAHYNKASRPRLEPTGCSSAPDW